MRILLVTADSTYSGAPLQVSLLARGLANEGVETYVACPEGWLVKQLDNTGVQVHLLPTSTSRSVQQKALAKIIKLVQPSIVHAHGVRGGLYGRMAANPLKQKVVYTEHLWTADFGLKNIMRERVQLAILKWLDRRTHHTVAVSEATKKFLVSRGITSDKKVTVIPGAIEKHPQQKLVSGAVGTLGTLTPVKGVDRLVAALPLVPKMTLVVGGDGPARKALEEQARTLGVSKRVNFLGATTAEKFFPQIGVYVQASRSESFGLAPLEAMMRGIPTIVTKVGALPELIQKNDQGLVCEPTTAAVAAAITTVLSKSPLNCKAAHERACEFSPENLVAAHIKLYKKLTADRSDSETKRRHSGK